MFSKTVISVEILYVLWALLPSSGYAQVFKTKKATANEPASTDKSTETKSTKPPSKPVKRSSANPPKIGKTADRKEDIPKDETKSTENNLSSVEQETSDCSELSDCIDEIQATLDGMKTASELERLTSLTAKAELLLVEKKGVVADVGPATADENQANTVPPPASPVSPPLSVVEPVTGQAVKSEVSREEYNKLLDRLSRLESEYSAVSAKADAAEERVQRNENKNGFKIFGPNDSFLSVGLLLQTRMEAIEDAAPAGDNWSFGLYLRRLRLMFSGELTKWFNFFVETEQANFGMNGDWGTRMFIQDAFVEFNIHSSLQIDAGMMLPPFSRHGMQSATSLFGMDYHTNLIRFPSGSNQVWRDMGIMAKGLVLKDHLEYRLAVWSGVHGSATDPRNPKDLPRLTGRITANIFEAEGGPGVAGMFYDGIYLKKEGDIIISTKRILSIGASFDWQPDLNVEVEQPDPSATQGTPPTPIAWSDYIAAAGDVFWDIPFGKKNILSANGQVNFYYYDHGDRRTDNGYWYYNTSSNTTNFTGWGMFCEVGIRYSRIQPIFAADVYESTEADAVNSASGDGNQGDYLSLLGGLNYYLSGNAITFKFLTGADKLNGEEWKAALKLQLQLVF